MCYYVLRFAFRFCNNQLIRVGIKFLRESSSLKLASLAVQPPSLAVQPPTLKRLRGP